MEELKGAVAQLTEKCSQLETSVTDISKRLEEDSTAGRRHAVYADNAPGERSAAPGERSGDAQQQPEFGSYSDLQSEFKTIREGVAKIKLPQDLVVGESRAGVGRADLPKFQTIQKCARYQETVLKVLAGGGNPETIIANITSLTLAQIRYLQEEYTNLLVSHQFDEGTAKLFQTLQQNPAAFTPTALDNLQRAVAIAGARQTRQVSVPDRGRGRSSFFTSTGFRGRGYRSGFPAQQFSSTTAQPEWMPRGRPGAWQVAGSRDPTARQPSGGGAGAQGD